MNKPHANIYYLPKCGLTRFIFGTSNFTEPFNSLQATQSCVVFVTLRNTKQQKYRCRPISDSSVNTKPLLKANSL